MLHKCVFKHPLQHLREEKPRALLDADGLALARAGHVAARPLFEQRVQHLSPPAMPTEFRFYEKILTLLLTNLLGDRSAATNHRTVVVCPISALKP